MRLINATNMVAAFTQGTDKTGRESLVVAVKGTFTLPLDGSNPELHETQHPLIEADECFGEPGFTATRYESDFAPEKQRCDVLLNGSAHAANNSPTRSIDVGLRLGTIAKTMRVVGDRNWEIGVTGLSTSQPKPFLTKEISYGVAFGGVDNFHPDEEKRNAYMANPVGKGYHYNMQAEYVAATPLPNTEERSEPVQHPSGIYRPMAFGPIGRAWPERAKYAGTYDQQWIDNTFPFLPDDFDSKYYQCAPPDQQCDYLKGGETVQLINLTSTGNTTFQIPTVHVPIVFFRVNDDDVHTNAMADTLMIEPDSGYFSIVWRARLALKRNMFEVSEILAGQKSRAWWRAKTMNKAYYPSLAKVSSDGLGNE